MEFITCTGDTVNVPTLSDCSTQELIDELQDRMAGMDAKGRSDTLESVMDGYETEHPFYDYIWEVTH